MSTCRVMKEKRTMYDTWVIGIIAAIVVAKVVKRCVIPSFGDLIFFF